MTFDFSELIRIIVNTNIFDGADIGIQNDDTSATLDAVGNYWGSIEGPTHANNSFGDGDTGIYEVSDDNLSIDLAGNPTWEIGTSWLRSKAVGRSRVSPYVSKDHC